MWGEADEKASDEWRASKIKDFEEGGATKEKYETLEALNAWMDEKVYGPGGTMDKTLKLRGSKQHLFKPVLQHLALTIAKHGSRRPQVFLRHHDWGRARGAHRHAAQERRHAQNGRGEFE